MKKLALLLLLFTGCHNMASYNRVHDLLNGFPTAPTGTAWFYLPGTTTPMVIFGDDMGTATTNPVMLDNNGAATVYLSQLARMVVQTNAGVTVSDTVINGDSDNTITTTSAGFSGLTLKGVGDAALVAFGGPDYQYVPSGSWVGMTPRNWNNSVMRNVMAYGSVGATQINDGVTPADTAIAAAIADVQANGGGVVYFPPGGYLCNSPIVVSGNGVVLKGSPGASTVQFTNASGNGIVVTGVNGFGIEDLEIAHTSVSTGSGILLTSCSGWHISNVNQFNFFAFALNIVAAGGSGAVLNSELDATGNAADRGIRIGGAGGGFQMRGGTASGGAADIEITGTSAGGTFEGVSLTSSSVLKNSATTSYIRFTNGSAGSFSLASTPQYFYQTGNGIGDFVIGVAIGATAAAMDLGNGWNQVIHANAGGAGTVTVPAPTPATGWTDQYLTVMFKNGSGGAVTWSVDAAFKLSAAIPTTDGHSIIVVFKWDSLASKWREVSRADTAT